MCAVFHRHGQHKYHRCKFVAFAFPRDTDRGDVLPMVPNLLAIGITEPHRLGNDDDVFEHQCFMTFLDIWDRR